MNRFPGRRTASQATSPATRALGRPGTTPRLVTTELRTTTAAFKSLRSPSQPAQLEAGAAARTSNVRTPILAMRIVILLGFLTSIPVGHQENGRTQALG